MNQPATANLPAAIQKTQNLPSLPAAAVNVLRVTRKRDATIDDLAAAVALDPGLAAKLLKTVNSVCYSRGVQITTLSRACMVLGIRMVKLLALSFSLVGNLPRAGRASFNYVQYWRHSVATAVAAGAFGRLVNHPSAEEAFLCGLLWRIGQLVMAKAVPESYDRVIAKSESVLPTSDDEMRVLGYDRHQVADVLLTAWGLPEMIVDVVAHSDRTEAYCGDQDKNRDSLCDVVRIADSVATVLGLADKVTAYRDMHGLAARRFGLTSEEVDDFIVSLKPQINEMTSLFEVRAQKPIDYRTILDDARRQMMEVSLGAVIESNQSQSRAMELEHARQESQESPTSDPLTHISNRAHFDATLETIIEARCESEGDGRLAVLIMDIDHFRSINDNHGRVVGDSVLQRLAGWLNEVTRDADVVARYDGGQFAVVVSNVDLAILEKIAERIRAHIAAGTIEEHNTLLRVTVSLGGACVDRVAWSSDGAGLLELAKKSLHKAKQTGRNRSVCSRMSNHFG